MSSLELRFLGDFAVRRGTEALPLPPSKKTRALLAYLSLQPRRFSREHLCGLLWEIPDDPLGALRWSLSKLRRLVDDDARLRVLADRTGVEFDSRDVIIDVRALRDLAGARLATSPTEELEAAAATHRGNVLEGLEFSSYPDFHAWCMAEREQSLRDRVALLGELVRRTAATPDRALPHARALVGLSPYDEAHRATLIRLLNAAHRASEAEEQYQLGLRLLREAGVASTGAMHAARRVPRYDAPPLVGRSAFPPITTTAAAAPVAPSDTTVAAPAARAAATPAASADAGPVTVDAEVRSIVGREVEHAALAAALDEVTGRRNAAVLLLSGPPGIGKSCVLGLARQLARQRGATLLQAAAFESGAIRPFAPWIDALQAHDRAAHDAVFGDDDRSDRDRLFDRLSDLVTTESANRPLVLLFDDLQWCDESSAAALHLVARRNRSRPVLVLLAARDDELRDNSAVQQALRDLRRDGLLRQLEIGPLPPAALAQLIDRQAPGADSVRLGAACGGNPLLAIELARAEARGSVANSLDDLVRERVARYGVAGAEVLRWAAVLSPRIDLGNLVRVSGFDAAEVGAALELAQNHAMLRASTRGFAFAHELIARAVYNDISPLRRQVMHRRIAELLEKDAAQDLARAADLAHHAVLSGSQPLAARAMVSAGRLCLRFFANDDALSLARKGLAFAAELPDAERVCIEIDLHDILLSAGPLDDWVGAAAHYAALAERALDHGAPAHARLGYHMAAYVRWTRGDWNAAREQSLQSVRAVRGGHDEAQIVGMAESAKCLVRIERDISRADAMLMEAQALAARSGFRHHAIAAGLGMLRFHEGRMDEAGELLREARTLCRAAGDRVDEYEAIEYLVMLDIQQGHIEQARERSVELLALGARLREGSEEPFARAIAGLCTLALDDDPAALDAALADLRIADAKHRLACVLTRAAMIDCERGRAALASGRAMEALRYATLLERPTEQLLANAVLARDCAALSDAAAAGRFADEAERVAARGAAAWTGEILARCRESRRAGTTGRRA